MDHPTETTTSPSPTRRRPSNRSLGLMAAAVAAATTVGIMTTQVGAEPAATSAPVLAVIDAEARLASEAVDFKEVVTEAIDWLADPDGADDGWIDDCPGCGMG